MRLSNYLLNELSSIYGKGITFVDVDEVLFNTFAKIYVIKNDKIIKKLSNQEFNTYKLKSGESFNYDEFRDADLFYNTSKPIIPTINRLKSVTPSPNGKYARIYLISNMLTRDEILGLHKRGDCYVSLDRGEGFGLPQCESGAAGNPIIVTGFGGVTEFAKFDNSYLVNYVLTPCFGMSNIPWYTFNQLWAEPSVFHGAELMRYVYNNKDEAKKLGEQLQKDITKKFSWEEIGKKIIKELEVM